MTELKVGTKLHMREEMKYTIENMKRTAIVAVDEFLLRARYLAYINRTPLDRMPDDPEERRQYVEAIKGEMFNLSGKDVVDSIRFSSDAEGNSEYHASYVSRGEIVVMHPEDYERLCRAFYSLRALIKGTHSGEEVSTENTKDMASRFEKLKHELMASLASEGE